MSVTSQGAASCGCAWASVSVSACDGVWHAAMNTAMPAATRRKTACLLIARHGPINSRAAAPWWPPRISASLSLYRVACTACQLVLDGEDAATVERVAHDEGRPDRQQ